MQLIYRKEYNAIKHYVVVDKNTREVIACISDNGKDDILRKDVELKVYEGTEPVFTETDHGVLLKDNAFTMKL
uniref:hypothetical protein n=1 Tax=Agathobacter sp. TaxID=2021311 RepID=UPI004028329B